MCLCYCFFFFLLHTKKTARVESEGRMKGTLDYLRWGRENCLYSWVNKRKRRKSVWLVIWSFSPILFLSFLILFSLLCLYVSAFSLFPLSSSTHNHWKEHRSNYLCLLSISSLRTLHPMPNLRLTLQSMMSGEIRSSAKAYIKALSHCVRSSSLTQASLEKSENSLPSHCVISSSSQPTQHLAPLGSILQSRHSLTHSFTIHHGHL